MPSRSRSRNDRWRLGIEPVGKVGLPVDMLKRDNLVGLPPLRIVGLPVDDGCDSSELVECVERLDLAPIFINERCFGEQSRDGVAILSLLCTFKFYTLVL